MALDAQEWARQDAIQSARRWLVLGASGGGKSTFAVELGRILDLPVVHLDRHYWRPGWVEPPSEEWDRQLLALTQDDEWVMDGNYSRTLSHRLPRANVAVLLDFSTLVCLWGVVQRSIIHRGRGRPDMAPGCPERLPDRAFLRWVLSYKRRSRPRVLGLLEGASHVHFVRLRNRNDARHFLATLEEQRRRTGLTPG